MFYQPYNCKNTFFNSSCTIGDNNERIISVDIHHENHIYKGAVTGNEDPSTGEITYYDNVHLIMSLPADVQLELDDYCMLLADHMDMELA